MVLNQDFSEFVALLNEKNVKYLIIGGYAVAYHGYPRYTKDLDIWVWLDPQNAVNIIDAIEAFGMGSLLLQAEDFLRNKVLAAASFTHAPDLISLRGRMTEEEFVYLP